MRLIDADRLLEKVYTIENGGIYGDCEVVDRYEIENAPTVDTYTIEDIQEVRENSLILGAKLAQRPQVEFAEKLKARIEENVCKRCPMNKNCVLCEISRVFQIIQLTAEEQKGGTE